MNKKISMVIGICLLPFAVFFLFFFLADGFGFHTLPIIISQSMVPTTLGLAMACVMPAGLTDFSPGARMLLGAFMGGMLGNVFGVAGFLIGSLSGAMAGGFLIAMLYRYLKIPSMVVSLGIVLFLEAFTDRLSNQVSGSSVINIGPELSGIANYPKNILLTFVGCLILYYIMYKTKLGCQILAVGNDEAMLKNMGVNVEKVKFKAFVASSIFIFIASMLQICYSGGVQAITAMGTMTMVFKPMMGVLIAMQLVKICDNMPLMIVIGEVTIQTVFNGFIAMGLKDNIQNIVLGVFLIVVLGASENRERAAEWLRKKNVRRNAAKMVN